MSLCTEPSVGNKVSLIIVGLILDSIALIFLDPFEYLF